ncbi:hypothetical protein DMC30DRAFT_403833 [Rhodotorula diobovata]|uniref:Uncharacterized protein n=1 Tax=Rhodotorula diobovata TaxID=5288 RepID=A0A5C5FPC1_9BASI|nr:hypothetical protein DMC30DRAFT_403833 [Rhodotorula diobovata]
MRRRSTTRSARLVLTLPPLAHANTLVTHSLTWFCRSGPPPQQAGYGGNGGFGGPGGPPQQNFGGGGGGGPYGGGHGGGFECVSSRVSECRPPPS